MNEWDVFVTNLNVVLAETVLKHCWALERLLQRLLFRIHP